jgi:glycosyltransferase involved in cell wall biosynthesis
VRQYDEPVVSVVIPVGPGHTTDAINALDSLDAQTFRRWEAILVNDTGYPLPEWLEKAFPHVRHVLTEGGRGAGAARNAGARIARGNFLLFLDADDWLYPEFLEVVLGKWETSDACVYTDYVGKTIIQEDYAEQMMGDKRLLSYDRDSGNAIIAYEASDYDDKRAQRQPEGDRPWIWCNITTLVPLPWHFEIGGFDEDMRSWEDVDYWYRLSRMGKPFIRVPEQLMVYQFHSGHRRQDGYENFEELIAYMQEKYKEVEVMPCVGCRGRGSRSPAVMASPSTTVSGPQVADSDFQQVEYVSTKLNQHPIVGTAGFQFKIEGLHMIKGRDGLWHIHYGFRAGKDRFLVHRRDIAEQPHVYQVLLHRETSLQKKEPPAAPKPIVPIQAAPEAPQITNQPTVADIADIQQVDPVRQAQNDLAEELLKAEQFGARHATPVEDVLETVTTEAKATTNGPLNLQLIPGVTPGIAHELTAGGITTVEDFLKLGEAGLQSVKGVGAVRAKSIWTAIMKMQTDAAQVNAEAA